MAKIIAGFAMGIVLCMSWWLVAYIDKGFFGVAIVVTLLEIIALVWGIFVYWDN